ncbi:MAG: MmcQ/YjbR family DNA-binding protein [Roseburia sp.]|nr:MmcQ/YjbR family DNA-binding protein [Anaeroplasma bactoclasticum]MCM1196408.1 MmcQ/YjbR family DNA-binding protein [Roseburia sp.]MCM1557285.1 MmcQ/YjbR family DNA-binding protein [Anaeroplasma bactoclasticum]
MNNILASFFNPQQSIILIVVSVVGLLLIILNIVLFIYFHRRGERKLYTKLLQQQRELYLKQLADMRSNPKFSSDTTPYRPFFNMGAPVEEPQEQLEESLDTVMVDEDQDVVDEVLVDGNIVRYNRSFLARLIQASDLLKKRYSELKNYLLSYKGVKSKISWKKESFRVGRKTFATFVIRGKTLCLCLALDPKQFEDTKYKVNDLSIRSPKTKTPCLYRISNERRFHYAMDLIDMTLIEGRIEKLERATLDYTLSLPFETTDTLIERDLIRIVGESANKPEMNAEPISTSVVVEPSLEETEQEDLGEEEEETLVDDDQEVIDVEVVNGIVVRYNRSFTARLIQAPDLLKARYSELKNYLLSYKGVKSKISWKKEAFRYGRNAVATFVVRGKTLCLCLALDPKQFEDTKYKVKDLSIRSSKTKTPCLYRISNDRRLRYAKDLINLLLAEQYQLQRLDTMTIDYSLPYENTESLIEKGFIKDNTHNLLETTD